jgi:polysaccharide export outer membrane protein
MIYDAASLPANLAAPRTVSARQLNIGQLAQSNSNSQRIDSGDLLEVTISTGLEVEQPNRWSLRVGEDGTVNVPLVGRLSVGGRDVSDAEREIRDQSIQRGIFRAPNVSVQITERQTNRITVIGAVESPGVKELPVADSNLFAAIVAAGGLSDNANTVVEIRQAAPHHVAHQASWSGGFPPPPLTGSPASTWLDLADPNVTQRGELRVQDGAVVHVLERPQRNVYVIGLVQQAGEFELPEDRELRLLDALALARGRKMEIADKVRVIRHLEGQTEPVVIEASVREAKRDGAANIRLAAGDVVSVEQTPLTFAVETINSFVRFGFTSAIPGF